MFYKLSLFVLLLFVSTYSAATPLTDAVLEADYDLVSLLLKQGENPNVLDEEQEVAALHIAANHGDVVLAKLLISHGADVNFKSYNQSVALHFAIYAGNLEIIQLLGEAGADLDAFDDNGQTVLQAALRSGELDIAEWLLDRGVSVNNRGRITEENNENYWSDTEPEYPIFLALSLLSEDSEDNNESSRALINKMVLLGAIIDIVDSEGNSFIFSLLSSKDEALINGLLPKINDYNVTDDFNNSALHKAIKIDLVKVAMVMAHDKEKLGKGAEVADKVGYTPIHSAYEKGMFDLVDAILEYENTSKALSPKGQSVYHSAYLGEQGTYLKRWLEKTNDFNVIDNHGDTLLHEAVRKNDVEFVEWLISQGANPNIKNNKDKTPLLISIEAQSNELITLLLPISDKAVRFTDGSSLMHKAVVFGSIDIVKAFKNAGVATDLRDENGFLPAHTAINFGQDAVLKYLVSLIKPPMSPTEPVKDAFSDPRIEYWSLLYWADMKDSLLEFVEKDLSSANSSVLAPQVWVQINHNIDNLPSQFERNKSKWAGRINVTGSVKLLEKKFQYMEMVEQFPPDYAFSKSDIFGLIHLAYAAGHLKNMSLKYDYLETAARLYPNFWNLAWMYEYTDLLNNPEFRERARTFATSEGIKGSLVGNYVAELAKHRSWGTTDRYNSILKWLELSPKDPRALSAKSIALDNKSYYSEAQVAAQQSMIVFPFYSNRDQVPEMLIKQGQLEQAKAYIALTAKWYQHEGEVEPLDARISRYYSSTLLATGDKGAARKEIEPTLLKYPQQVRLNRQMAKLESADGRYNEAANLKEKVIKLDDKADSGDYKRYIEAVSKNGEKRLALDIAEQALIKLSFVNEDLYVKMLELAMELDQTTTLESVYKKAIEQLPDSILLVKFNAKWLWKQGKQKQALERVESLLVLRPNNYGFIQLWKKYSKELNKPEQFVQLTRQKVDKYHWSKNWWNIRLEAEGDSDKKKIALWNEASKKNKSNLFFCQEVSELHTANKDYEMSEGVIVNCINDPSFQTALPSVKQNILIRLFWMMERQSKEGRVSEELLELVRKQLAIFKNNHGSLVHYYRYSESFYRAVNDVESAAHAFLELSKLEKDSTSHYHDLVARYGNTLNKNQVQGYGYNMIQRSPYNKQKLLSYLHKQLLWNGSPINALKAIENAKKRGVEYDRSYERRALSELGDTLKLYENYSLLGEKPSASKRYINWFDNARKNALTSERKEIIYDFSDEKSEVRIVQPNGEVITREDHPVFSTVTHFKKGAAFINVTYDENGNMTEVNDSSGQFVKLEYNKANKIERIIDKESRELEFVYNEQGKPRIITIVGLGSIYVIYDEQGEIEKTSSEQGHRMALQVTQAFQSLLSITKRVKKISSLGDIPSLPNNDKALDKLVSDYNDAEYGSESAKAQLSLAGYLVDHVTDSENHFDDANELLIDLYRTAQGNDDPLAIEHAIQAVQLWYALYKQVKPSGLPLNDFALWSEMRTWLAGLAFNNDQYKEILKNLAKEPLSLLKDAQWLVVSDIKNTGFWKRYGNEELYSHKVSSLEKQAILIRRNGDILLATSKGLSVLRSGFWEWFAYDENQSRFSNTAPINDLGPSSNILSLAETTDGVLWLGTAKGLFAIKGNYDEPPKRWSTESNGLLSPRINTLESSDSSVYIGNANRLSKLSISGEKAVTVAEIKGNISEILLVSDDYNQSAPVLLNEQGSVYLVAGDTQTKVTADARKMVYNKQNNQLTWLNKDQLFAVEIVSSDGRWIVSEKRFIGLKNDLLHSKEINEMSIWSVPGEGNTLVVNTDLGINIFKDYYFQSMQLPFELSRGGSQLGPRLSSTDNNGDIVIASSDGVYTFQPSAVNRLDVGRVYDTLVDDSLGITYIATGSEILYIDHSSDELQAQFFSSVNARYLRLDNKGNLITNDGSGILRFNRGEESPQRLFSTEQSVEDDKWEGSLNDILIDSENTIWAAAGSSVFRYKNSMEEPEEYNYFVDAARFPSRSQMIYKIYQNLQGKIHVVASNEVHLSHKGVNLAGGLLEWDGEAFKNLGKEGNWFVTGYTKIDATTAIVTTNNDFTKETSSGKTSQRRESYDDINDPTYKEMKKKSLMIWLGKQGAQLGDKNTWLFPSAGGVVVYNEGKWFYPDRLNQLLPEDQALGQYGARAVHTVSIDKRGKVYVGTDLGLLVYESQGVASLLNDNHRGQVAFVDFEITKQQEVRDLFLSNIDPKSEQGKLINKYENLKNQIAKIEVNMNEPLPSNEKGIASGVNGGNESKSNSGNVLAEKLKKQLKARERSRQKLLANLEKNHYGLFQILKMDPREISAMHKKLSEDQAIIQYLPTKDKLFIQVVTNTGAIIRQVDVPKSLLEKNSLEVAAILRKQTQLLDSSKINRGVTLEDEKGDYLSGIEINRDSHISHLSWLYHYLIRPVENDLEGKKQVFITPVGALTYVPFSALIRQVKPKIEYAIDRYNIGILPSMYHFNLVMHHSESFSDKGLFIADPDGSLPGARNEVQQITEGLVAESKVLEGYLASMENIKSELEDTRIIHFATHGVLNTQSPEDSYLLLANKYQLNVIDIAMLDLEQADLVVLSACESGIGRSGLEYASLARAFAHAKVPSVVASYWMVHDEATREFMMHLYEGIENDKFDNFSAMSRAKKMMITSRTKYSHPAAWAGFEVFGKP